MNRSRADRVEDCVRTIMHNVRQTPVRAMHREPSDGPPGDVAEVTTADAIERLTWVVRTCCNRLCRSEAAAKRAGRPKPPTPKG